MDRHQKKCLIASTGLHGFLVLLLVVGSGFLMPEKKPSQDFPRLKVIPTKLIDEALSGGGGNPNIRPTDAVQKGETLTPTPPAPPAPAPKKEIAPPKAKPPEPEPEADTPVAEEAPPPKNLAQPKAKELATKPKIKPKQEPKPVKDVKETSRPNPKAVAKEVVPLDLKPVTRRDTDQQKEEAEAQAKAAARARAAEETRAREAEARAHTLANQKAAGMLGAAITALKAGFNTGTAVETSGPGGEAYAGYDQFVKEAYDNAWLVTQDLTDENSTARVSVTIRNTGHVVDAKIINRSGNTPLDRSVERALRSVRFIAPFPEGAKDKQRTFIINFNLKAKRLTG